MSLLLCLFTGTDLPASADFVCVIFSEYVCFLVSLCICVFIYSACMFMYMHANVCVHVCECVDEAAVGFI